MELEGSYFDNTSDVEALTETNAPQTPRVMGSVTLQIEHWERRIRNFNLTPSTVLYRNELPERSQSSLSFVNNSQLACSMTNRLGAQQGIHVRQARKLRQEESMNLADTTKKRRSRSADSRFGQSCAARRITSERAIAEMTAVPSTSAASEQVDESEMLPVPDVKIQINGEGVEI